MTFEEAQQVLDLIERLDQHAETRRIEGLEAHFDASDRQVAQLAQLKNLNMNDLTTGLIAELVASVGGAATEDPL